MSNLSFFIGKGGVGKTTVAAAYAVRAAVHKNRGPVLLLSTDPAHSLADIFEVRLGDSPKTVPVGQGAEVIIWQLSAEKRFRKFLARHREAILNLIEAGTMFTRREIEPLLGATLPGMAEFAALLAINDLASSGQYSEIVVDTAPLGHTLRLFEMPEHFARFLRLLDLAGSRDRILAERFGGAAPVAQPFIEQWRVLVEQVRRTFAAGKARISLVTTPETFALNEGARGAQVLEESAGMRIDEVVLNRTVTRTTGCARCRRRTLATRSAQDFLRRNFPRTPVLVAGDNGGPILGSADLLTFAGHVFAGKKLQTWREPLQSPRLRFKKTSWPDLAVPLSLTLGKGGVGKTTISAALAAQYRRAHSRSRLTICSTDPAPSLDDIFQQRIGNEPLAVLGDRNLQAIELDAAGEFRAWTKKMKARLDQAFTTDTHSGVHVDLSFERQVITALVDIVPPGVDEIFGVFRILDLLSGRRFLLIDMAPTGHALELLRMPERIEQWSRLLLKTLAPHRTLPLVQDAAVEIASIGQRVRDLRARLRDAHRTRVWPVMLAEPLPDRETRRLLRQLRELGIQTAPLFVNRVIFTEDAGRCARCRRANAWQMRTLASLRQASPGHQMFVVRDFPNEIAGTRALKAFTGELWHVA